MNHFRILLVALLFTGGCTITREQVDIGPPPHPDLDPAEIEQINAIETTGRVLYELDNRTMAASDLLMQAASADQFPDFYGSVTRPWGDDYRVAFYQRKGNTFRLLADVEFDGQQVPTLIMTPFREPLMEEASMVLAQKAALTSGRSDCSNRLKALVLPDSGTDNWEVYVLATASEPGTVQVGGHVRVLVPKGTGSVLNRSPLSSSCLVLNKPVPGAGATATVPTLAMGYSGGPLPSVIHAYLSLQHGLVLTVFTKRGTWSIVDGKIQLLKAAAD